MSIVRFAPTASGSLHIGNLRILIANYLFICNVKTVKNILLRVDFQQNVSLNEENNMIEYVKYIIDIFNIDLNLQIIRQRERFQRYKEVMNLLIEKQYVYKVNDLYYFNLSDFYNRNYIVRFNDLLIGKMYKKISNINNPIIYSNIKNLFFYNFMSIIDDIDFGIKCVIRGNDHIDNTYLQICMMQMINKIINFKMPEFMHIPMCVTRTGKISKSSGQEYSINHLLKLYIFPEVIKNYLIDTDNFKNISKSQKVIDINEIKRLNKIYIYKSDSKLISNTIKKIWNINISIEFIQCFKFFVQSLQDLININNTIQKFKNNEYKINISKDELNELKKSNNLLLYKKIGLLFGYEYLGKEIIQYLGMNQILDCIQI